MYVNVQAYGTQFRGKDAEVVCVWDVTDKHRADQALRQQTGVLSTIINSTQDLIWSVNKQKRFLAFNESFSKALADITDKIIEVGDDQPVIEGEAQYNKWQQLYDRAPEGEKL
ncbi:PAS domain-containing protein [Chitinophaga sedimenti]|uniref:PAS domain-containing protein n=1 Tax=Chitinophaga sedimenti TaxID=2033606 RepID=UPI0020047A25|nr:PAS domain-containing protein [Chitinophaga sedimenti]MCK7555884.1 PAS domain-containing protein [Chitinophaga sedimenti]